MPDVVPLTTADELTALHRDVLSPSFPATELVPLDLFLAEHASGHLESLGVLADGQVVAGVVGSWSEPTRVLLVQYLAIAPGRRGGGIGSGLLGAALDAWERALSPLLVLAEVEHPGHHAASEAHGDPEARLRFYARAGGRVLAVPYFQPGIGPGAERVPALLLVALRADPAATEGTRTAGGPASVPAAPLRAFLEEYLRAAEGSSADDDAARALLGAVAGERVALLGVDELDRVPVGLLGAGSTHAPTGGDA